MKYIPKNQEPEELKNFKSKINDDWQPTWKEFQNPEKKQLHQTLLKEQGYICCYCGRKIIIEQSHIEHFKPKRLYPQLTFEYSNLIVSCEKDTEESPPAIHCGHQKDEWFDEKLLVSPLLKNCVDFFRYAEDGQILSSDKIKNKKAAQTTIGKLRLNIPKLRKRRRAAIEAILPILDNVTSNEIKKLITGFETIDSEGQYTEFCFVIVDVLKEYL
ncbi:TIGR02646 family protein [Aphanothece hegewaldii CCALA 016]|uniref:TIGR02646 family protein n=1 Tax=Aphanothece hegewaldii CCALA 016 TaxID=2107694 RepID=A0A2T1M2P0_9CHRO|nr:retron system putative HNH endonuclease [Aphanothece hegewaldii]PSF39011.1 TIGR02646 family protein [Aphanothece hegewaldii CCALA 016]